VFKYYERKRNRNSVREKALNRGNFSMDLIEREESPSIKRMLGEGVSIEATTQS